MQQYDVQVEWQTVQHYLRNASALGGEAAKFRPLLILLFFFRIKMKRGQKKQNAYLAFFVRDLLFLGPLFLSGRNLLLPELATH